MIIFSPEASNDLKNSAAIYGFKAIIVISFPDFPRIVEMMTFAEPAMLDAVNQFTSRLAAAIEDGQFEDLPDVEVQRSSHEEEAMLDAVNQFTSRLAAAIEDGQFEDLPNVDQVQRSSHEEEAEEEAEAKGLEEDDRGPGREEGAKHHGRADK